MRIVTQTDVLGDRLGDKRAVEIICQSGFSGIDYSMFSLNDDYCPLAEDNWKEYLAPVKAASEKYAVPFVQSHSPFPTAKRDNDEYNKFILERTERAFEVSEYLGVEIMVVHPISFTHEGTDFELNYNFYKKLLPFAEKTGVKIALENMWGRKEHRYTPTACGTGKDFRQLLDMLDNELFVACLDLGHCGMVGEDPAGMIRTIGGKYLQALHVHDNDKLRDAHIFPFNGTVDWNEVTKALAQVNYSGNLTFEADNTIKNQPESLLAASERYLHEIGAALVEMIDSHK